MNHSFYGADQTTHLKVVVVVLLAATIFIGISTAAHLRADLTQSARIMAPRAGMPAMATIRPIGPA